MLYTNGEQSEEEIKKTIPFTIASKRMKYLGINLTNEAKDVYTENYKMLLKKLRKTQINWKTSHVDELEGSILLKCQYYLKQFTDLIKFISKSHEHILQMGFQNLS